MGYRFCEVLIFAPLFAPLRFSTVRWSDGREECPPAPGDRD